MPELLRYDRSSDPDERTIANVCTTKDSDFQDDPNVETYVDAIVTATGEPDRSEAEQREDETPQEVISRSLVGRMRSHPVSVERTTLAFARGLNKAYPPTLGRFKQRLARYTIET